MATKLNVDDMEDAIAIATGKLGLLPGVTFQARVLQLAQLNVAHRSVCFPNNSACFRYWMNAMLCVFLDRGGRTGWLRQE